MPQIRSIERVCETCGTRFLAFPQNVRVGGGKYCSRACTVEASKKEIETKCLQCGKVFKVNPSKLKPNGNYCSTTCMGAAQKNQVLCVCLECGKEFKTYPSEIKKGGGKYCSPECYRAPHKQITVICETCGKSFVTYPSNLIHGQRRYCSYKCAGRVPIVSQCRVCGKQFKISPSTLARGQGKYCSKKCSSIANSGTRNPRWRGGAYRKFGANWKAQRRIAYERDGGTCQYCGLTERKAVKKYGKRNSVHHIVKRRTFRELGESIENANALRNLITLCCSCHRKAENGALILQPKIF